MSMRMIEFLANLNKIHSTIYATTRTGPKSECAGQRGQGLAVGLAFRRRQMASGTSAKSGFPDLAGKFPDPPIQFPVTPQKIPVPMRREFPSKSLDLLRYLASFGGFTRPNGENSLFFPC